MCYQVPYWPEKFLEKNVVLKGQNIKQKHLSTFMPTIESLELKPYTVNQVDFQVQQQN